MRIHDGKAEIRDALTIGEGVINLERVIHVKLGLTPEDDIHDVGPRFQEPPPKGPGKINT